MRARSILTLLVALSLTACIVEDDGDDDDGVTDGNDPGDDTGDDDPGDDDPGDDDPGDDDPGDDPGDDPVEPRSGAWEYSGYDARVNDCDIPDDYGDSDGGFGLVNEGGGSFRVFPNDGTDAFDCSLDGADFTCPDRATESAVVDPQFDAVLVGQATAEGTFSDPENATGSQTAIIECEGSDCGLLEAATGAQFPCTFTVDFVIDWRTDG